MRHWLEYVAVRALVAMVAMTPSALIVPCGRALGLAWFTVNRSRRRIADANLAAAFPSRSAAERQAIARRAFAHFIAQAFETLKFSTLSRQQMLARVEVDGEDRVRLAYGQGKGVLFITGTSASGNCTRSRTRCCSSRSACWPAPSTTPA